MPRELKGWARPRPLRVAFLVEDGEYASLALDGIFADCYDRWGGRFSLIAPCFSGQIAASYWPWLEAYDPDIVYSYVPLSRTDVLEIHERLSPSQYAFHELGSEPRLDVFGFKPSYRFSPLSSLSTIFRVARHSPRVGESAPVKIIDSWHTEEPSRSLTDNFGAYHVSRGGGIYPPDASAAASLVTIVSPEKQADRRYGVPRNLNAIASEFAALKEFAEGRATSLSLISALFAPKLDIRAGRWSGAFNLVVGDSFTDRILFWNARLLIPAWLDRDLCCLRVGFDQLKEPEFLATLGDLLKRRNHVNSGGGGQSQLAVRSGSLNVDQLAEARQLVLSTKPWSTVSSEAVAGLDDVVPSANALQTARESNRFGGGLFAQPEWTRFVWSLPMAQPPATVPDHLSDAPVRQAFTTGYWCTDFIFEYDGPGPRFGSNNRWMLPRRWRMAGAFKSSLVGEPRHVLLPVGRRSRDGNLTIFVSADNPVETIEIPGAYSATRYALAQDGARATPDAEHGLVRTPNKVVWMAPSNEARYLTGVLGMAGGLQRASQFLLHPFLRKNFAELGGTPSLSPDQVTPTVSRLQKRAQREAAFDLRNESERQSLAQLIVKAARELKSPMDFVSYDDLKARWKEYRAAYWAAHPQQGKPDPDVDWDKHEEESLDECLIELRRRQMMFQGYQWTCRKCHYKNWVDLAALSFQLSCEVCKQSEQTPVDIHWLFRPNEFLIESVRDHSVLSLIWALSVLRERSRTSFIFVEPTWFGFTHESKPDAEADLLAILDGQTFLCEVKSSWHGLRASQVAKFVALAKRLRPDIALLAVMEAGPGPRRTAADLDTARSQLAAEQIEFQLLTPDPHKQEDDPYLQFDAEE
ncbi:MAG: hypothetical protein Q7S58_02940 [Candidatus Binatus sp.]|uniref:hypothetical protein n=1 Tax=Candidatus Binatus sp. TaxID=2811406 RepID=UPI00271C2B94|nr:hypothetical protein [Candidatus Binatus sp.]MDO8431345.1 hypothetical protein [Candidatus Binatus sp.]